MATLDPVVAGDVNVTRTVIRVEFGTLEDGTGEGAAAVEAHIWRGDTAPETLPCTVTDAAACEFEIDFGDTDGWLASRPAAGPWLIEYQATYAEDDQVVTVPALWPDDIMVRADHDPEEA